ncbi:arylamine N-acetyltransferase [Neobacillus niacini]|uniref:arylamine N-acetyltransferase family protein n=1 Tax=Neobacillus niacini TaxID=86668 RepID=UPI0021CB8A73|nr:arylamine N-acetyltransferase [Neobacillus niacini]MCM3764553.1 arylamine N-acetyltransferase [Neobacillus niacini]
MTSIDQLFRERIDFPEHERITFEKLDEVLERIAFTIPFENICVMNKSFNDISRENVVEKILTQGEGGVCYELNTILYYFLLENGFDVKMVGGVVFNSKTQDWSETGRTHVLNLVKHEGMQYLVDSGFGGNIPLKPVPLNGQTVTSSNGDFRVKEEGTEHGDFVMEMKLKHRHDDWATGYAFDSTTTITDVELNEIQKIIVESPASGFNKGYLATRLTSNGSLVLSETSFTQRIDDREVKEEIDRARFKELAKEHFGLKI